MADAHAHAQAQTQAQALRHRKPDPPQPASTSSSAHPSTDPTANDDKARPTVGRTADGTVFSVPTTHDMVSTILDPRKPKSEWDLFIVAVIAFHLLVYLLTDGSVRKAFFLLAFAFWRLSYNVGIGWVLHHQSKHNMLVKLAKKHKLFDPTSDPRRYRFIKRQLADKMGKDYNFEASPVEYQTWLLFRRGVDLILMLDFSSYVLLAFSWSYTPLSHGILMHSLRWTVGWLLVLFNLWVKLDANRVVKDFAWYWGDFFYLIDSDLTFDGVYELCMHPMYSLGYAGYYGISLLACSYAVLFVSIVAHIMQFLFLYIVEEPHITKTYSPKQTISVRTRANVARELVSNETAFDETSDLRADASKLRELNIFRPFDPYRATDLVQILSITLGFVFAVFTPASGAYRIFAIGQAFAWRLIHSAAICWTLHGQSNDKVWTRHFLKYGESPRKAWSEWKAAYALSLTFTYVTFLTAFWKCYSWPNDWQYSTWTLRHVLGLALVGMHVWTSASIYDVLGDFGWYFGDFFVDRAPKLKYTGVYRYLNNPERIVYSFWGFALMSNSTAIIVLAAQAQVLNLAFITFVEKPHTIKVYGKHQVRKEAGFTRSLKSMPVVKEPQVRAQVERIEVSLDEMLDRAVHYIIDLFTRTRPHIDKALEDSKHAAQRYSHPVIPRRSSVAATKVDKHEYALELLPSRLYKENLASQPNVFHLGEPISCKWRAPAGHAKNDWIGIYLVSDNLSREITRVSSRGRWTALHKGGFQEDEHENGIVSDEKFSGTIELRSDCLPWSCGAYELRYHHAGKHDVLAISQPIEITVPPSATASLTTAASRQAVEADLVDLVRRVLSSEKHVTLPADLTTSGGTGDELEVVFGDEADKYGSRLATAIRAKFDVHFAWQLVANHGSIRDLADRIVSAKQILAPFVERAPTRRPSSTQPADHIKESQWT
ncbi:hypothetical protein PYCC9005_003700 [Savitreella phatthalungensis]